MKKNMTGILFGLALTAGLMGCGGGKKADVPAATEAVETTTEAAETTTEASEEPEEEEEIEKLYCWIRRTDGEDYCLKLNDEREVWIRPGEDAEIDEDMKENDWLYVECGGRKTEEGREVYTEVSLVRHIYADEIRANWNKKERGFIDEISDDAIVMDTDGFKYTVMMSDDTDVQGDPEKGDYIVVGLPYDHEDSGDFILNDVQWVIKAERPQAKELIGLVDEVGDDIHRILLSDGTYALVFVSDYTDLDFQIQEKDMIRVTYGVEAASGDTYACSMVYSVEKAEEEEYADNWNSSICGFIKRIEGNKIVFDVQDFDMTIMTSEETAVEEGLTEGDYIRATFPHLSGYPEGYVFDNAIRIEKEERPEEQETTAVVQFIGEEGDVYLLQEDGSAIWLPKNSAGAMTDGLKTDMVVHVVYGGLNRGNCWGIRSVEKVSAEGWNQTITGVLTNIVDHEYVIEVDGKEFSAMTNEDTSLDEDLEAGAVVSVGVIYQELPQEGTFWSVSEIKNAQ